MSALRAAAANLRKVGPALLARWDATALPLPADSVDRVVSNPPFGKQLSSPEKVGPLYHGLVRECDRVLKSGGKVVLLGSDEKALREAVKPAGWQPLRKVKLEVLGQPAAISVWQKPP